MKSRITLILLFCLLGLSVFAGVTLIQSGHGEQIWKRGEAWLQTTPGTGSGAMVRAKILFLLDLKAQHPALVFTGLALVGFVSVLLGLGLLKIFRNKRPAGVVPVHKRPAPPSETAVVLEKQEKEEISQMEKLVGFFLNIYRIQIGAPIQARARYALTPDPAPGGNRIYELAVKLGHKWKTRRMSIGPLGEDTGSKSKCFYVIYDSHLVVKIPPTKNLDYLKYIQDIEKEAEIASILAPRECVTPKVSVVLKRIHTFPQAANLSPEELEEKYIALSKNNSAFQKYLKIDNAFVFFMDLSTNFFLGSTLKDLHANPHKLVTEIMGNPDIIWDHQGFIGRYESRAWPICNRLQHIFSRLEYKIKRLAKLLEVTTPIHDYQLRKWFLRHLCKEWVQDRNEKYDPQFIKELNDLIAEEIATDHSAAEAYRETIRRYVAKTSFSRNRTPIENIVTNLVDLLHWLDSKGVALRDLKPDNLFIVGQPERYPDFLKAVDQFSIGVIDVETALALKPDNQDSLVQPLRAGTPLYATPSHLLANPVLEKHFGDLPRLFRLQDWYAMVAMIFRVITGRNLFRKSAKVFPVIVQTLKNFQAELEHRSEIVGAISNTFWQQASREFEREMLREQASLELITVSISKGMADILMTEIRRTIDLADRRLQALVDGQAYFKSARKRSFLLSATPEKIARQRKKWKVRTNQDDEKRLDSQAITAFLREVETIKSATKAKTEALDQLGRTFVKIDARQLMQLMFDTIHAHLYRDEWRDLTIGSLKPSQIGSPQRNQSHGDLVATV